MTPKPDSKSYKVLRFVCALNCGDLGDLQLCRVNDDEGRIGCTRGDVHSGIWLDRVWNLAVDGVLSLGDRGEGGEDGLGVDFGSRRPIGLQKCNMYRIIAINIYDIYYYKLICILNSLKYMDSTLYYYVYTT